MDVQRGHCWRCEKALPDPSVHCNDCPLAVYCTASCKVRDRVRHKAVECQIFGPKCNTCGNKNDIKTCAQCTNAWYCNKRCQKIDWRSHKHLCRQTKDDIKSLATFCREKNTELAKVKRTKSAPYYIGNTIAKDFLNLDNNEWSGETLTEKDMAQDYHVLSAGCGDLRNTVLTAGSLPDRYQGKLHVTLNDFDPFVMARNVLFLFMLVRFADTEGIESSLTTIWYSVHITKKEYDLIKTSLDELIQMDAQNLNELTNGLVVVQKGDLRLMSQVWKKWQGLECRRNVKGSINLRKQRKDLLAPVLEQTTCYLWHVQISQEDKRAMEEWFDHGLFYSYESYTSDMPFDNVTMTGRKGLSSNYHPLDFRNNTNTFEEIGSVYLVHQPKDYEFVYCITTDSIPFSGWDWLKVKASTCELNGYTSPMVMYHKYVTNLLRKVKDLATQGRLCIQFFQTNCLEFPTLYESQHMPAFDRVFTSNLSDYLGFAKLLQIFKPLLNCKNRFSVVVTETINWSDFEPTRWAYYEEVGQRHKRSVGFAYFADNDVSPSQGRPYNPNVVREYHNNTECFLVYLRAEIMAGGHGIPSLKEVPSFGSVMTFSGMQMRDFRKELNRVVPFKLRTNVRGLSPMTGFERVVEWCLPDTED
ncbi:uncharacterized protein [Asterias amurensis]